MQYIKEFQPGLFCLQGMKESCYLNPYFQTYLGDISKDSSKQHKKHRPENQI